MIDSIHVLNVQEIHNEKDKLPINARVISITDSEKKFSPYKSDAEKVCVVFFEDLDYNRIKKEVDIRLNVLDECELFDDNMADKVYCFITKLVEGRERIPLYIHCHAGVSLSAAVARFAADMSNINYSKINNYNNLHIADKLAYDKLHEANRRHVMPGM